MIDVITKLLDLAQVGALTLDNINALRAKLVEMQGRDPTDAEWTALFDDIDANTDALNAADERLNP